MLQPTQFGKYLLLERIAVGGMAEVFVAKQFGVEGFERLLAIKKILPTMGEDSEFNTMFVDEARIAVQLAHANIVQVLELGKVDDNLFIAMEYISGRDVRQLLERFRKRGKPLPIPQACTIVGKVCEALDYAHRKRDPRGVPLGIVHRDVSPQNVLVSFEGDVKLIDFGIAKAESRLQRTQAGILKGKFSYMSPEQVRGQAIDHRSDIFAVGVLLWELLCGEKLFTGDSDFAVLEKVRTGQIPLPRKVNPDIPEALERVMMKALATEVRDRYQWASELHDALVRFTLLGDMVYGARQLSEWIREEFSNEFAKEQQRLRTWLGITDAEVEVTPSDPMRRKPLPRMPQEGLQPLPPYNPSSPPFSPRPSSSPAHASSPQPSQQFEQDPEPLVQPPTPTGVRHRVPLSKTATPPPGELRAVAPRATQTPPAPTQSQPPPPPNEDLSHELPTMKMDGNVLAAAEKALAQRRAEQAAAKLPPAFGDDNEDSVTQREDGPMAAEAKARAHTQAQRIGESNSGHRIAAQSPYLGPDEKTPADAMPIPPQIAGPRPVTLKDRPVAPRLPASLDPALLAGERLVRLPVQPAPARPPTVPPPAPPISTPPDGPNALQPVATAAPAAIPLAPPGDAFDNSEDRTAAPRAQRKGAFAKPLRVEAGAFAFVSKDPPKTSSVRNGFIAALLIATAGAIIWSLWPTDEIVMGKLVLTITPSASGELFIDGKSAGQVPPFVRTLPRGHHKVELRAANFKNFSASVEVATASRPTELQIELVPERMQVEGVVLDPPPAGDLVPREPTRARWLTGKQNADDKPEENQPKPDSNGKGDGAKQDATAGAGAADKLEQKPEQNSRSLEPARSPANAANAPSAPAGSSANPPPAPPSASSDLRPGAPASANDLLSPPSSSTGSSSSRGAGSQDRATAAGPKVAIAKVPAGDDLTRLKVTTTPPGADITIDGNPVGKSPVSIPDLDTVKVNIVEISLDGFKTERRVAKASDGHFTPLNITLQPVTPSGMPAPGTSAPNFGSSPSGNAAPAPAALTPAPAVADTPATPTGYLVAQTSPVARVFIDGKDTGRWTPVMPRYPIAIPPGPHTVTFETPEGHKHDESINIEAGKTSRVIKMGL